ncbi:unnamed protein product, partial [Bubo scandiacus]
PLCSSAAQKLCWQVSAGEWEWRWPGAVCPLGGNSQRMAGNQRQSRVRLTLSCPKRLQSLAGFFPSFPKALQV